MSRNGIDNVKVYLFVYSARILILDKKDIKQLL